VELDVVTVGDREKIQTGGIELACQNKIIVE
jgi:hypothetical protein